MDRINRIKEKLEELKNLDKRFAAFGANTHQYRFNPVLKLEDIKQIEEKYSIYLSEDYKQILMELGNGGAGYGYGLEPIMFDFITPPYKGTEFLLRNCEYPKVIECEMVDLEEISGYIRLFNLGCGMEYGLIVNGKEIGDIIFFDCDERFKKVNNKTLYDLYEEWLDENLIIFKRVRKKMDEMSLQSIIESEWEMKNFSVKSILLSLMDVESIAGNGNEKNKYLERVYKNWIEI